MPREDDGAAALVRVTEHPTWPTGSPVSLPELPEDVFLLILEHMDAWDVIRCQKVSRAWRAVFSHQQYQREMLRRYPLAREVQDLAGKDPTDQSINWQQALDKVGSRYFHLTNGKARLVRKYKLAPLEQFSHWYPVSQWDYHESQPGGRLYYENATHISRLGGKPYLFRPTLWTCDDGLIVFAPSEITESPPSDGRSDRLFQPLVALDIETDKTFPVPFDIQGKMIRNIRLKEKTLVIEWAEKEPYHALNDLEKVHRHFVTCFDVQPMVDWSTNPAQISSHAPSWSITIRSEWKMHFLGFPLNHHDRFFSTHTRHHYALYFWQPNRSMYTGDEELPIEALSVWDIASSSPYLPSTDPTGKYRPRGDTVGPRVLSRFSYTALDFLGVRQHSNITLIGLRLDSASNTITVRENVCVAGQGYFDPAERLWCAKSTSFPFVGDGPCWVRQWDGILPPYRGHCTMESMEVEESERWFLPVLDVVDAAGDGMGERVRFSVVETCFTGAMMENRVMVRVRVGGVRGKEADWVVLDDKLTDVLAGMGRIAGDERWLVGQSRDNQIVILKF